MASLTCRSEEQPVNGQQHTQRQRRTRRLPAQHTQNQVKNEKGAEDHKTDKVHPWKLKSHSIIHLEEQASPEGSGGEEREREREGLKRKEKRAQLFKLENVKEEEKKAKSSFGQKVLWEY